MFSKSWFFSENRPKSPFRGKGLFFGGRYENGQNEAEAHGFGNRDAKISTGQGIAAHGRRNDEGLPKLPRSVLSRQPQQLRLSPARKRCADIFAAIPDTSPARYNKPFQNINAFLNWALEQELIGKNPIKVHKLHKRRDDGNIKPLPVNKLQAFLASLDKSTYTGLRDYVICMQCSSTKESRRRSDWQSSTPLPSAR